MGMFDTFYGKINCIECNKEFCFEEQTKCYDNFLLEFLLGDYIDKGNANYFYHFTTVCPICKKEQKWAIAIKRGQIVGYYPEEKATLELLNSLENIEDGYARNFEYKEMCSKMLGIDRNKKVVKEYFIGEIIEALETKWVIDEIHSEELDLRPENESINSFYKLRFKENLIFKVHKEDDESIERLIILRNGENIKVCLYDFTQNINWDNDDYKTRYISQSGTVLKRIL